MRWTVGALTGAAVLVLVAGCGTATNDPDAVTPGLGASGQPGPPQGGQPGGPTQTSQPKNVNVGAALKTSEKEFALLTKGDWAAAWQLWTGAAKKEVPKNVFVETNTECPAALKRQYQLQAVQPVDNTLVELTFRRGDEVQHGALRNDKSGWLFDPGSEMLADYASGAKAAISKRKAANQC